MKPWMVSVQLNGEETTDYYDIEFQVSERLYAKMQTAIKKGIPLVDCPFYGEIEKKAEAAAEDEINWCLRDAVYGNEPVRSDYDCRDDYEEALEEYLCSDSIDNYYIEAFDIYDPYYINSFEKKFIGRTFPSYAKGEPYELKFKYEQIDCICAEYYLTVHFDENGTIIDITDITGEALESEDVRGSSWDSVDPDYEFLESCLEYDLNKESEDE